MGYPNFMQGPDRSLRKPDVHLLASLCEEAGVDLRILVLNRQAEQIYHSTVTNRKFSRAIKQTSVLLDNAFSLYGQLAIVDKALLKCVNPFSEAVQIRGRADELGGFLHPAFAGPKRSVWHTSFGKIHQSHFESPPSDT